MFSSSGGGEGEGSVGPSEGGGEEVPLARGLDGVRDLFMEGEDRGSGSPRRRKTSHTRSWAGKGME